MHTRPSSCLLLPHGLYSLLITVLVTIGWVASLFEDGCTYARVTGPTADKLALSPDAPYVEVGLQAYRVPRYNAALAEWNDALIGTCLAYPAESVPEDGPWKFAKACSFLALVLGGGATLYLWISACCRFSRGSWRWAGYEVAAAAAFQALSFVWFQTELCRENNCALFYGSQADIAATVLWLVAACLIFCHYPVPKEIREGDGIVVDDDAAQDASVGGGSSRALGSENNSTGDLALTEITSLPSKDDGEKEPMDEEMAAGEDSHQGRRKSLDDVELT